jgi:hypothetical protein
MTRSRPLKSVARSDSVINALLASSVIDLDPIDLILVVATAGTVKYLKQLINVVSRGSNACL